MTEEVDDLARKAEKMRFYGGKLEFLGLSCPKAGEYVVRVKKIGEEDVFCERGNVKILDAFFGILEFSEIEELKFHILEIGQQGLKVFKKKLKQYCFYKTNAIVFNQSADPQLIIDFSVKCPDLKYLLVRGYNQTYPCNKTDYLIRVYTSNFSMFSDFRHVQRRTSTEEIVKCQVPLMCKPIEWTYEKREQFLTEKIPEDLLNAEFMHNSEFFFVDPSIKSLLPPPNTVPDPSVSQNSSSMIVIVSESGVFCKVQSTNFSFENVSFDSLRLLCQDYRVYWKRMDRLAVERTLRMRSLFYQSDEERDLYSNQKTLMDMPLVIIDKIMDNLTISERLSFRESCRQLYRFPGSQKYVVKSCDISVDGVYATIDGKRFQRRGIDNGKELLAVISKNGYVKELFLDTNCRDLREKEMLIKELENIKPIRVAELQVEFDRDTYEDSMKFLVEKCKGSLESIDLRCCDVDIDFNGAHVEKVLSARDIYIEGLSSRSAMEGLEAYVERAIVSGNDCGFFLQFISQDDQDDPDDHISLAKFEENYCERTISKSFSQESSTVRLRTDHPTKHILITARYRQVECKVVSADFVV